MIEFADRSALLLPIKNYPDFSQRSEKVLCRLKLGAAGSAICDDASDLHVSIAGLVGASESLASLAATVVASRNGQQISQAKASAARENGKKGGRPRTVSILDLAGMLEAPKTPKGKKILIEQMNPWR